MKFNVSCKLVQKRDGLIYSLNNYKEGVDYVLKGCFKGQRAMFRQDILSNSVAKPLPSDHPVFIPPFERATLELDEKGMRISWPEQANIAEPKQPESQPESTEPSTKERRPATPADTEPTIQVNNFDGLLPSYCPMQECKIKKIYANFKWVETDKGRVWVGLKGNTMRVGQIIRVKNGELFLGKTSPSSTLTKL